MLYCCYVIGYPGTVPVLGLGELLLPGAEVPYVELEGSRPRKK